MLVWMVTTHVSLRIYVQTCHMMLTGSLHAAALKECTKSASSGVAVR